MGLFHGVKGSKKWRQIITPPWNGKDGIEILNEALETLPKDVLDLRIKK